MKEKYKWTWKDKRIELWPDFDCSICSKGKRKVSYESQQNDTEKSPVCYRCGAPISEETVEKKRPPEWHQPIILTLIGINGISCYKDEVINAFDSLEEFIDATKNDFYHIHGVGEDLAEKIVEKREEALKTLRG